MLAVQPPTSQCTWHGTYAKARDEQNYVQPPTVQLPTVQLQELGDTGLEMLVYLPAQLRNLAVGTRQMHGA
jgi:hypothetical protein